VPVQIHTGLFAGSGNVLTNSRPTHLINTFLLYPRIQFDIFHLSYPYQEELGVLAKSFRNVHADFCWAYVVSPPAARRALDEFLETVPANKILGFGGDYKYPELSYAHAQMARQAVAQVLAAKVERGVCSEQEALDIGGMLLYQNAARLFSWPRRQPPSG
jgi:predicted TIM-barrel fold metal-dependent hydrolase